jgi:hypothetical protein
MAALQSQYPCCHGSLRALVWGSTPDLSNPEFWIKDPLDQPDTWSATAFHARRDAHRQLVEKYCITVSTLLQDLLTPNQLLLRMAQRLHLQLNLIASF